MIGRRLIQIALTGVLLGAGAAQAGVERVVELDAVPPALRERAARLLPDARFVTANTETEADGTVVYELQGRLADGRGVEVDLFADGEVEEFEIEFTRELVPDAVLQAVAKRYPGFRPSFIEATHSETKKVVGYEFFGERDGKEMDLDVSADGRRVELADR